MIKALQALTIILSRIILFPITLMILIIAQTDCGFLNFSEFKKLMSWYWNYKNKVFLK